MCIQPEQKLRYAASYYTYWQIGNELNFDCFCLGIHSLVTYNFFINLLLITSINLLSSTSLTVMLKELSVQLSRPTPKPRTGPGRGGGVRAVG